MLKGLKIIVGISGGIAAYKTISLIRLFIKNNAQVKVVTTQNALNFVTLTTLESISKNKVYTSVFAPDNDYTTEHIALTDWGDIFIVAPATANIIGKYACGIADDALSTSLMAFDKKVYIAPAMNCKMWNSFQLQNNIDVIKRHNNVGIIEPENGFLACGYEGKGRMAEPQAIYDYAVKDHFNIDKPLINYKVLVTAGPTYEAIDPVRFIGNHSSGLMGYCLAEAFACLGAKVTLVSGPTQLHAKHPNINTVKVVSASEMNSACLTAFPKTHITIMAAAVADYMPKIIKTEKIKKTKDSSFSLEMVPTPDILQNLGKIKTQNQILAGFALETNNEIPNAKEKLKKKNLDFIVLNSLNDEGAGFGTLTNKITIIDFNGIVVFNTKRKEDVALDIASKVLNILKSKTIKKK